MERTLNDSSLIQATIYFRYYVHQALKVAGMGDHLLDNLQIWRDQMALGLTTWAEMPEPTRSDCHAWGASPNIEFFRILLGIDSNAPGFKSIRIPVSYLSKIGEGPDYTIDSKWLDRVQEVVDMCIDNGLYAIINVHGDGYYSIKGGWLLCGEPASEQETIKAKYEKVWEQIANRFKNYDDHLVFESMNEVFDGSYGNPKPEYYNNINAYNQIFVDTVRKAGGNNNSRYLLIPGWNTDINFTTGDCDTYTMEAKLVIPNDSRIMVSVHYYTPWEFCVDEGKDTFYKWGDSVKKFVKRRQSETLVNRQFDKLYNAFIKNGYGVVIGEYGSNDRTSKDKSNTTYRAYFAEYVNYAAHQRNIVTVYWDNGYNGNHGFGLFDRTECTVTQPEIIKGIINGAKATTAPAAPTE